MLKTTIKFIQMLYPSWVTNRFVSLPVATVVEATSPNLTGLVVDSGEGFQGFQRAVVVGNPKKWLFYTGKFPSING